MVRWMVRWIVQCGGVVCKPILVFSLTQAEQLLTKGKAQENKLFLWQGTAREVLVMYNRLGKPIKYL